MKEKILIIDDSLEMCRLLQDFLTTEGYEAIMAHSAQEGFEKLKKEKPKVVLLDIKMPETDGIDTLKHIKRINKNICVIMITGVMDENMAKKALKLGAMDYVTKPCDFNHLRTVLLVKILSCLEN
ncbi:response regulator [Candidatus Omnitrophota bacterium]